MGRLGQDIRYAVRTAVRTPSVSILAILAFALGIGVTTAVFSIFNGVLLAPLPFPDPDELVMVGVGDGTFRGGRRRARGRRLRGLAAEDRQGAGHRHHQPSHRPGNGMQTL